MGLLFFCKTCYVNTTVLKFFIIISHINTNTLIYHVQIATKPYQLVFEPHLQSASMTSNPGQKTQIHQD
jgi:hypothetical protein